MTNKSSNAVMGQSDFNGKITLAITGASGAGYALRLIECLVAANYQLYILCSSAGRIVVDTEVGVKIPSSPDGASEFLTEKYQAKAQQITVVGKEQWVSPVASGSAVTTAASLPLSSSVVIEKSGECTLAISPCL